MTPRPHLPPELERMVPGDLRDAVDVAGNGELFWFGDRVEEVARWVAGRGLAIVGGEIYKRHPVAWATYVGAWRVEPGRRPDETWDAYVERGLAHVLAAAAARWPDPDGGFAAPGALRYFFACADRPARGEGMSADRAP